MKSFVFAALPALALASFDPNAKGVDTISLLVIDANTQAANCLTAINTFGKNKDLHTDTTFLERDCFTLDDKFAALEKSFAANVNISNPADLTALAPLKEPLTSLLKTLALYSAAVKPQEPILAIAQCKAFVNGEPRWGKVLAGLQKIVSIYAAKDMPIEIAKAADDISRQLITVQESIKKECSGGAPPSTSTSTSPASTTSATARPSTTLATLPPPATAAPTSQAGAPAPSQQSTGTPAPSQQPGGARTTAGSPVRAGAASFAPQIMGLLFAVSGVVLVL